MPKLLTALEGAGIDHEILVVNDNSNDGTRDVLLELSARYESVRFIDNPPPNGFGLAVRAGLAQFRGDAVAIMMADGSDDPADLVKYHVKLRAGYDCVFGSRFIAGSKLIDYPTHKLIINRLANLFISILFQLGYNDITNAFKCYRRAVIAGLEPILAHHFNLTVELPLKAIIRGYSFAVVPISWTNRASGASKLKIREMGSRYLFIVLYCYIERLLRRKPHSPGGGAAQPMRLNGSKSKTSKKFLMTKGLSLVEQDDSRDQVHRGAKKFRARLSPLWR
jgi:dolichol-phosphate mannosyltransferase